jgi:3alpha(or 20beta)-hydroxysteroid dehydrogenase
VGARVIWSILGGGAEMGRLDGSVALITGAARGQGEAEARLFVEEGAKVVLGDVRDEEGAGIARSLGDAAEYVHLDVTQKGDWAEATRLAQARFGKLDALVNNAGIIRVSSLVDCSQEEFESVLAVNVVGVFLGIQAVIEPMRAAGGGSIVNVSSVNGFVGVPDHAAYTTSKFGSRGLTKAAAVELGPFGIRVNSIHPGVIDTHFNDIPELQGIDWEGITASLPLGRSGSPLEIARLSLFLCSSDSSYSTGSEFIADGGILASP